MMQEDKYHDFDLQIRSMLQDAEEEVPSRVWDAVSSRIDREKVAGLWWRRAAAGVAAAAAVALGVFFALDRQTVAESPALAEVQPAAEKVDEAAPAGVEADLLAESSIDRPAAVRRTAVTETFAVEQSCGGIEVPDDGAAEEISEKQVPESDASSGRGTQDEEYRDDPFARMAYEDAHKRSWKESVTGFVQGNVTSNERSRKASSHMSSSSNGVPTKTGMQENSVSTYGIPLSFGVGAKYRISERWSVSAALNYSLLSRSFTGTYYDVSGSGRITREISADVTNNLHYIGIPVNVYFDVLNSNRISFYAFGGFTVEKGIVNKYRLHSKPVFNYSESVPGLQWSSALGLGLEFMLNDYLALYIDPSARYYFDCNQPKNVRTQKPFMMNFEVGLRFNI
jgi:hypothetical protein